MKVYRQPASRQDPYQRAKTILLELELRRLVYFSLVHPPGGPDCSVTRVASMGLMPAAAWEPAQTNRASERLGRTAESSLPSFTSRGSNSLPASAVVADVNVTYSLSDIQGRIDWAPGRLGHIILELNFA